MATSRKASPTRSKAAAPKRKPAAKKARASNQLKFYAAPQMDKDWGNGEAHALLVALENAAAKYGAEAHAEFQSIAARLRALL